MKTNATTTPPTKRHIIRSTRLRLCCSTTPPFHKPASAASEPHYTHPYSHGPRAMSMATGTHAHIMGHLVVRPQFIASTHPKRSPRLTPSAVTVSLLVHVKGEELHHPPHGRLCTQVRTHTKHNTTHIQHTHTSGHLCQCPCKHALRQPRECITTSAGPCGLTHTPPTHLHRLKERQAARQSLHLQYGVRFPHAMLRLRVPIPHARHDRRHRSRAVRIRASARC